MPASRLTGSVMVGASLALNIALGVWLSRDRAAPPAASTQSGSVPVAAAHRLSDRTPSRPALPESDTNATPPFLWSQVESADYRQYVANLRAIGCPEQVIRDLIAADLQQLFSVRAQAIWQRPSTPYWKKFKNQPPGPDQMKQLTALDKEQGAVFKELLGAPWNQQQMVDTLFLQLHGSEQQLLFLPPDRRDAASAALADADFDNREMQSQQGGFGQVSEERLFAEKLKALAGVLSPAELEEFKLRNSLSAPTLRTEVQYFNCTPEEFKTLLDARDKAGDPRKYGNLLDRAADVEQIRQLFGDDRAKEFERVSDMFYINARRALETSGLPVDRADQAWRIAVDARTAAERVAKDTSLPADERKRQVQALRDQADAGLVELLGARAAGGVSRDLRVVLRSTEMNIQP